MQITNTAIDGNTRIFGIIGDPIAQVRTPQAMNELIAERQANAVFIPFHVRAERLSTFIAGLESWVNLPGFTLTIPHKEASAAVCKHLGPHAQLTGSVNVVRKRADGSWEGETFDGIGFVLGLKAEGIDPAGADVLIHGAGGAASAIAAALAEAGAARLRIANRSPARAAELVSRIEAKFPGLCTVAADGNNGLADIVVNATSLGLHLQDGLPFNPSSFKPEQIVAEVIMKPDTTELLKQAMARGCRIHRGIHMLKEQVRAIGDFLEI